VVAFISLPAWSNQSAVGQRAVDIERRQPNAAGELAADAGSVSRSVASRSDHPGAQQVVVFSAPATRCCSSTTPALDLVVFHQACRFRRQLVGAVVIGNAP
jgi:hypothetical protein